MMQDRRILILGAGGFVGKHLIRDLEGRFGGAADVVATSRQGKGGLIALDLMDDAALRDMLQRLQPTHIINLVGIAAPAEARKNTRMAWELHAMAPERLGHLILEIVPHCWFFHMGSGLVYGRSALDISPIDETAVLRPMDIYGVTKAAGDLAVGMLAEEGLRCLRLRPFNHTGPGQSENFAIPSFASQIARIEAGLQPPVLKTGNLDVIRDFLDVRDVAAAYGQLIAETERLAPGTVFNIASGTGWKMADMLDALITNSHMEITVEPDPTRQRESDLPKLVGDASALRHSVSWVPNYTLHQTLHDILYAFRNPRDLGKRSLVGN